MQPCPLWHFLFFFFETVSKYTFVGPQFPVSNSQVLILEMCVVTKSIVTCQFLCGTRGT